MGCIVVCILFIMCATVFVLIQSSMQVHGLNCSGGKNKILSEQMPPTLVRAPGFTKICKFRSSSLDEANGRVVDV